MLILMSVKNIIITSLVVSAAVIYVVSYIGYQIYKLVKHIPSDTCDCKLANKNRRMLKNVRKELDKEKKCSCSK